MNKSRRNFVALGGAGLVAATVSGPLNLSQAQAQAWQVPNRADNWRCAGSTNSQGTHTQWLDFALSVEEWRQRVPFDR